MNTKTTAVTGEGKASRRELNDKEQRHWNQCCASFCTEIQQLALQHRTTWQQIFRFWREYAASCESSDQSAVMFEFEQTLKIRVERRELPFPPDWPKCVGCGQPVLNGRMTCGQAGCDAPRAKTSYEERHERILEVTQGRTIWNSDGLDGPVLVCAPSHSDIQRMAGFPEDREGFAVVVDEEERASSDEDYGNEENYAIEGADDDDRAWNESDNESGRDDSVGDGETAAERNA